jgi:hypothetical protein
MQYMWSSSANTTDAYRGLEEQIHLFWHSELDEHKS